MDLQHIVDTVVSHQPTLQGASGQYAVLVPLVRKDGECHLLFEIRASSLRSQPNEVCFPGGRMEKGETAAECAVRETCEELGFRPSDLQPVGPLDFLTRGCSIVFPVLALVPSDYERILRPNPDEVSSVFTVPLTWFQDHPPKVYHWSCRPSFQEFPFEELGITRDYPWLPLEMEVPVYSGLCHPVWGMTARITSHLIQALYGKKDS